MRIGILGGTFAPIHNGHLRLAVEAKEQLDLDFILIVPAYVPPHKLEFHRRQNAEFRSLLIKKVIKKKSYLRFCDFELRQKKISYTINTIQYLKKKFGLEHQYFLLLGSDWDGHLNEWKDAEQLKKEIVFVMAKRDKNITLNENIKQIEMPVLQISSSMIRDKLQHEKDITGFVPDCIVSLLIKNKSQLI